MEPNIPGHQKKGGRLLPASSKEQAASQLGASVAAAANLIQMDHSLQLRRRDEIIASQRAMAPAG
ncbi:MULTISPECIES: hypothetical protein [unclassified Bradyrhizobium]|uniref:hypothetical protein n=1 Tax=unclassified Bradyrhizobium TaxID=2631580 RepID=UPI001FFA44FA|nr:MULTISPECIES: hypothetical protein [unclassified Bradyrhizobium]MCK1713002.1 hypothetical protein [Bradyrhizobium sp. 143]MCK1724655.1 hypothetical protein [Bradyrhizobium sp. 142]